MRDDNHFQSLFRKSHDYYGSDRADILPFVPTTVKTCLEFGCGKGEFSALIKDRLQAETWAVELHQESADIAANKIDHVISADAMAAMNQLPDNYFDAILFLDVLEHIVDPYSLLAACKSKLSTNGVIIASIPNVRYYRQLKNYVCKGSWEYKEQGIMDITHLRFFTYSSIQHMFKALGYSHTVVNGIHESRSNGYRLLNTLFLNRLWDARYKHFVAVAGKSPE